MLWKIAVCIVAFIATSIVSWFALWSANIIIYIMSLPISVIDIIVNHTSDFIQFIYLIITIGLFYFSCYSMCYNYIFNKICNIVDDYYWLDSLVLLILTTSIIAICDSRLHSDLPFVFKDIINKFQTEYNYFILGTVSWDKLDFSGNRVSDMQYTIFDISVILAAISTMNRRVL